MPRFYKRILLIAVLVLGVATGAMVAFGDQLAEIVARRALARAAEIVSARGVDVRDLRFERARVAGFGAIRCDKLSGTVTITPTGEQSSPLPTLVFTADTVALDAHWPWSGAATVTVISGKIQVFDPTDAPVRAELSDVRMQTSFSFSWWDPGAAAGVIEDEARRMVNDGWTRLALKFNAVATFRVAQRMQRLPVGTETIAGGGSRIVLDRADVERLSREYINPLTETEIDLVTRYPHRAPALLRACEQASRSAWAHRHRDRTFPRDAYRHVYWSWLLTKEFGPEFSEEVTDAHEIGATYEVGSAARRMDLQNNAMGRAYALAGVEEDELVDRVLKDPNVVRVPAISTVPPSAPRSSN